MTPSRSLLFVPVLNVRAVEKSKGLACDGIILDLEDAIAPDRKAEARKAAIGAVAQGSFTAPLQMVRVNSVDTQYFIPDISALAQAGVAAIVIPKVNCAADLAAAVALLDGEPAAKDTQLWIMIETALGVMNLREICAVSKRLKGIIVGPNDLLKDLKAVESKGQDALLTSYGLCLLAARAYGLICIDGVYKQFTDAAGFAENCAMGRILGFDGKSLIHPAQIAPANAAFGPNEADIDLAKRQVQAFKQAVAQGKGVAVVDGALVEGLHVETARDLLKMAKAIANREGS
ncbi:MAG: CoA ester lyase [Amylibacter sp.]|nr:CoA ester lyase [Amylibacter sp.]